ncbi:MAG TPA: ATP-dependent DNA helicase, partial [Candidatus Thermoplasmatota archaeon]|nr:ATP-dependent DNA helicase [Candidatus Thermoplasmatota archaeon]
MPYCPTCKGILRPERGILVCLRCSEAGRARTVMANGRRIVLGKGQQGLGTEPPPQAPVGQDAPLRPKPPTWRAEATEATTPHPQLALFPHDELRDGQRRFARDVALAVQGGRHLVAQAPTGIGKTAASLAPALEEAMRSQRTVLFLTSRQSQHRIAVETLRRIRERRGARFSVVDLVSKRDMCLRREAAELHPARFPDFCARETRAKTCQFLRDVDADALRKVREGVLHVDELMHVGKEHQLCPHLLAVESAKEAHIVVADYNHLFSDLRERSLERLGIRLQDAILLVDEAHNLPDRIRQNHSHRVTPFLLDAAEAELRQLRARELEQDLLVLRAVLQRLAGRPGARTDLDGRSQRLVVQAGDLLEAFADARSRSSLGHHRSLTDLVEDLRAAVAKLKQGAEGLLQAEALLEALEDWSRFGDGALRYLRWEGDPGLGIELHVRLLDPSLAARTVFQRVHAAVLMSGTLRPPEVVRDLLGLDPGRTTVRSYPSPFPPANRFTVVQRGLSSRYQERGEGLWQRYAQTLGRAIGACAGNAAVFAPSYQMLRDIRTHLEPLLAVKEVIVEDPAWGKAERDQVLDELRGAKRRGGAVLFGVLGGSFNEGVDFNGNLLGIVAVIGLPLAPPDLEVEAMVDLLERRLPGRGRLY